MSEGYDDLKDRCMDEPFWAAGEIERLRASVKELTSATAAVIELANELERLRQAMWMDGDPWIVDIHGIFHRCRWCGIKNGAKAYKHYDDCVWLAIDSNITMAQKLSWTSQ